MADWYHGKEKMIRGDERMQEQNRTSSLVRTMMLTGLAFAAGGLFRTLTEWLFGQSGYTESIIPIVLAIWIGFLLEAAIGMYVLAQLLKDRIPFRRLYRMGIGAFAIGILVSAIMVNQFFLALLTIPGIFVGLAFAVLAGTGRGRGILFGMVLTGFILSHILFVAVWSNDALSVWLSEQVGPYTLMVLMNAAVDFLIGASIALGVCLMLQRRGQEGRPYSSA